MKIAALIACLSAVAFFISDCAGGHNAKTVAVITGKYYVPESTTFWTDSDGVTHVDTSPEEFHVTSKDVECDNAFDIRTSKAYSASVTNGQIVGVKWRVGKWTRWNSMHQFTE